MNRRLIKVMSKSVPGPQAGFSLVELLFAMALASILLTLAAFAIRQFWFQRSLMGGQDQIATQLRAIQTTAVSEGVSGRYYGGWFDPGSEDWGTVRYQSGTCTSTGAFELDAGVQVESVAVATAAADVNFTSPTDVATTCQTQLTAVPDDTDVRFVWFLARGIGTETTGNHIRIVQPRLDNRMEQIQVIGLTGRVVKL